MALPFRCNMLGSAAAADVELVEASKLAQGECEVVFPVGLPGHGYFDWVDSFLEKNPDYVELSDRKIIDWASKSGLYRSKSSGPSNDKPDMKFGLPLMDDMSVKKLLKHIAPTSRKNFIVPELQANLTEAGRKKGLAAFALPNFQKVT